MSALCAFIIGEATPHTTTPNFTFLIPNLIFRYFMTLETK